MKRTIAFLACVLLAVFGAIALAEADVALNAKNFPDAGFRQYILNAGFDTDGNGMLSDEELSWVTEIDCTAMSIADLTGIRQFTALERLFCGNNDLSALALNGCASLTVLDCSANRLEKLDVSGCAALSELYCSDNLLTSLDVHLNGFLTVLWCDDNHLAGLNVRGCTALSDLSCVGNQLTSLDVSGCTALGGLSCFDNLLSSLNVSGCTSLFGLYCAYNRLTRLDVSGNKTLTLLWCDNNLLTDLDVSGNSSLTGLQCSANRLKELDVSNCAAIVNLLKTTEADDADTFWVYGDPYGSETHLLVDKTVRVSCGSFVIEPAADEIPIPGDANGDGQHDMRDVLVILRNLRFGDAVPRPVNADMNGNDRMDLPDAMLIWQYLCGWKIALQ